MIASALAASVLSSALMAARVAGAPVKVFQALLFALRNSAERAPTAN
jgi:hypothetical protein